MVFCTHCNRKVKYVTLPIQTALCVRDISFDCEEFMAICPACKNEVYAAEVNDLNVDIRKKAYQKALKGE